jgi:hypothetical protein
MFNMAIHKLQPFDAPCKTPGAFGIRIGTRLREELRLELARLTDELEIVPEASRLEIEIQVVSLRNLLGGRADDYRHHRVGCLLRGLSRPGPVP